MVLNKKQLRPITGGKAPRRAPHATRKHRFRPGTVALREIRKFQKSVKLLIPKHPFSMLAKEVTQDLFTCLRWSAKGMRAIQEAAEDYVVEILRVAQDLAINVGGRKTIQVCDIRMAAKMMARAHSFKWDGDSPR